MIQSKERTHPIEPLISRAERYAKTNKIRLAARFFKMAAEEATAVWDNESGLIYISRALELTPDSDTGGRFQLLLIREELLGRLGLVKQQETDLVSLSTLAHFLNDDRLRARVAARMGEYKLARGEFQDVITTATLALSLAHNAGAHREAAALHLLWGRGLLGLNQKSPARDHLKQAYALAAAGGWPEETADTLRHLGVLANESGEYEMAKSHYEQALPLYQSVKDLRGQSDVFNNLGNTALAVGDLGEALGFWERAKALTETTGDQTGRIRLLINQSAACMEMGMYAQAKNYFQEAAAQSRALGLAFGEGLALTNLALAELYLGDTPAAEKAALDAVQVARKMGSRQLEGYAINALGKIRLRQNDLNRASDAFWEALGLWQELDQPRLAHEARAGLARVAIARQNLDQALDFIRPVIAHLQAGGGFEGTESPLAIFLAVIQVLNHNADPLANQFLRQAHAHLQQQAATIRDEPTRQSFLNQVAVNQEIQAAFQAVH